MGEYPRAKVLSKAPSGKSTDGVLTKIDDFFDEKSFVHVHVSCTNCKTIIRPGSKVCPICLHLQKDLKL